MAGIASIGWWIPEGRLSTQEIARDYGVTEEVVAKLGLKTKPVPGPDDHPSTMGARATRIALEAAGLQPGDLDLLIYIGVSKDWPAPWVAAFGVLHELGGNRAAGFDMTNRCATSIDALWLAKVLVESGTYRTIAVCSAERFDHLLGPHRPLERPMEILNSVGAACVIVRADARNEIVAHSGVTNPDLSVHKANSPVAGGSRCPLDEAAFRDRLHWWRGQLSIRDGNRIDAYETDADRYNYPRLLERAGFDGVDFVACAPFRPEPQLAVLEELGIDRKKTLFILPYLGHIGTADLFLTLAVAIASGRNIGRRIVLSIRTHLYSNAIAIRGNGDGPGIAVAGEGVDLGLFVP